ncbi:hypothetical protein HDU99_010353 [Rhizoclosmatium hyalinum]|nr:hypothetical protein HDU99_010353 [Rhizoclosmatium hyalinum]
MDFTKLRAEIDGCDLEEKRGKLQEVLAWLLAETSRNEVEASEAVSVLQTKCGSVPGFASSALAQITAALSTIPPKAVEAVPALLAAAGRDDGARDAFTLKLVKVEWPTRIANALALAFSDLPLPPVAHQALVEKLVRIMKTSQPANLASIVRFLLIQAKAGQRKVILQEILEYMNHFDLLLGDSSEDDWKNNKLSKSKKDAIRTEGTILIQICFAVRQNQDLGIELLQLLKANKGMNHTPFSFSLLLAMSQIHRFEGPALDALKGLANSACKDFEYHRRSAWIPLAAKQAMSPITIWKILKRIILKSEHWDNLIPDLHNLAFTLIESAPIPPSNHRLVFEEFAEECVWGLYDLGTWILLELCVIHAGIVKTIADQVLSRIITKPVNIVTYSYLLEMLARKSAAQVSLLSSKILEVLNCLGEVPVTVSERFLWAISPLFDTITGPESSNSSFRESLFIPLRKGMFSSDIASRKVSVSTLVHFLKLVEPPSESGSQNMISSSDSEIFYILRRGMNQQYDIRVQLCDGFLNIMELQPWLASSCLDLFISQFTRYYEETDNIRAPLHLEACFDGSQIAEPLPELMSVLMSAISASTSSSRDLKEYKAMFEKILEKLTKADLVDYEIDKEADYMGDSETSKKSKGMVGMLLGVLDIAIEYCMTSEEMTDERVDIVLSLYRKSVSIRTFVKDKMKAKKGFGNKLTHTPVSCGLVGRITMLQNLFDTNAVPRLRSNAEFTQQIVLDTLAIIKKVTIQFVRPSPELISQVNTLGQLLFCEVLRKMTVAIHAPKSPERGIFAAAVECFEKLFSFVLSNMPSCVNDFLKEIAAAEDDAVVVDTFVNEIQELIANVLEPHVPYSREAVLLIKCLGDLWGFLDEKGSSTNIAYNMESLAKLTEDVLDWSFGLWKSHHAVESGLSKTLVGLFCKMQRRCGDALPLRQLILCIQKSEGVLLEGAEDESQNDEFDVGEMNQKDLPALVSTILSNMTDDLDDVRWIVSKLKVYSPEDVQDLLIEPVIYNKLIGVIDVLNDILRTTLPTDASDMVFIPMIHVFKVVNGLLKYKIVNPEVSNKFCELMQAMTEKLRDSMVEIIPTMQDIDTKDCEDLGGKKGASMLFKKRKRTSRESKSLPTLIFETEQFDRYLIALHKKSGANLMRYVKRSTARDFKIKDKADGKEKDKKVKTDK